MIEANGKEGIKDLKMGKKDKKHPLSEESLKTSQEFGHVTKVASSLLKTLKSLVGNKDGRFLYNDLCAKLIAIIGTGPIELKGQRKITDGNMGLLRGFGLNRYRRLSSLTRLKLEIHISDAEKHVEITIPPVNETVFNAPSRAFRAVLLFQCILLDVVNYKVETIPIDDLEISLNEEVIGSKRIKIPIENAEGKVVILAMGICFYLSELNGDKSFISNNRDHLAGKILEAVYIKNGKIVTFVAPENSVESSMIPSVKKKIPWIDTGSCNN